MLVFIEFWKLEIENNIFHVFSFLQKLSFENNFCFLSILGYQTRFLVSKIENCFWKLKIRRKNGYQTYPYFHSMRLQKHLEWHGATRSEIGALKVPLSTKMTKVSLVNPGWPKLKRGQTTLKTALYIVLHQTQASRTFLASLTKFDSELTLGGA